MSEARENSKTERKLLDIKIAKKCGIASAFSIGSYFFKDDDSLGVAITLIFTMFNTKPEAPGQNQTH